MWAKSQQAEHLNLPTNLIVISGKCASNLSGRYHRCFRQMDTWCKKSFTFCGKQLCSLVRSNFKRQVGGRHKSFDLKRAPGQVPVSPFQKQTTNFSGKASWGTSPLSAIFFKLCHLVTCLQSRTQGGEWGGGTETASDIHQSLEWKVGIYKGWRMTEGEYLGEPIWDKREFKWVLSSLLVQLVQ